jgi:hypothetical protein
MAGSVSAIPLRCGVTGDPPGGDVGHSESGGQPVVGSSPRCALTVTDTRLGRRHITTMRKLQKLSIAAGGGLALYMLGNAMAKPRYTRWGATDEEIARTLPGDEFAPHGASANHAITIHSPVSEVWKWLVQIGQDRAGFYSYTVLENLFFAGMHNSDEIVPDWQDLCVGDTIRLASKKAYGDLPVLRIVAVEPNHYFVLEGWGAFIVEPIDENTTRLIVRSHRTEPVIGGPILGRALNALFWDPAHFVMERGMLRGIKERAERRKNS